MRPPRFKNIRSSTRKCCRMYCRFCSTCATICRIELPPLRRRAASQTIRPSPREVASVSTARIVRAGYFPCRVFAAAAPAATVPLIPEDIPR